MRPTLFRLASDTEDNDEALAEILQANDSLKQVINLYRQLVKGEEVNGETSSTTRLSVAYAAKTPNNALDDLDLLGKTLLQQSLPPESLQVKWDKFQPHTKPTLRDLQIKSATTPSPELTFSSEPGAPLNLQPTAGVITASIPQDDLLANMTVPLETIKPSSMLPLTIFDKHSLRVLFHFARSSSLPQSDVLVVIISMLSSSPVPITNIRFQAAVPKTMRVKLQPPSGLDLPAFNPLLPPAAITQVLLLANPHKEKVRLRYKLTFDLGEESHDESGDVEQFPPQESWMNL
ncbi:ADP-ribosylation factor-binding protein GGA1 [Triplophysa tibetana]|uniref:ADP-ribosylation factor-binding protein GGA1 n=1 Tax=Triplophysa tibetana TaxID=1572043 RepID=A0A5A9NT57_9TELE|nr:ADP-ribosylation factor-binding protein GGA1 [Triplophysa tibetana]